MSHVHCTPGGPKQGLNESGLTPTLQSWHEYDESTKTWSPVPSADESSLPKTLGHTFDEDLRLVLATWNVNAFGPQPHARLSAIFSHTISHVPSPDIIFLQEISRPMIGSLLAKAEVCKGWYSSEKDSINWRGGFGTMILLSRSRFSTVGKTALAILGRVYRIRYPSMMLRDALCGEIFIPTKRMSSQKPHYIRATLINVHLESTNAPKCSSHRADQLSLVSSIIHETGYGLIAGDFNPVDPRDGSIIENNGLQDAWKALRDGDPGYTWGVGGKERYPASRMDKVATLGLRPIHIEVMHPQGILLPGPDALASNSGNMGSESNPSPKTMLWSDHSGVKFSFILDTDKSA
ncbi:Endonuclease/exonuclease/phosphatase [Colletotrichum cereale]|nr:Endonuclease/exonuclease/phosphatase [Colletotrichum cereale]